MSTLVIKNFPDDLHALLKQRAQRNRRSTNMEAVRLLETGLGAAAPRALPPPVELRSGRMLGIDEIEAAIAEDQE